MKAFRWIAAFPIALVLSLAAWLGLSSLLHGAYGSEYLVERIVGYAPIVIRTAVPTTLFVVSAVLVSPSRGRKAPFVFFTLGLLWSGAGLETLRYYHLGIVTFWVTSLVGMIVGALLGLAISLRLQRHRKSKPIRPSQVTPEATATQ